MQLNSASFQIELPTFEGPFDLLLFFIERDELDIHEISITEIGTRFFAYIQALDELDLELSGDFIRIAARLIQIKARTLLPTEEALTEEEEEDPREALALQLIRYKQFKEQSEHLRHLSETRAQMQARGNRHQAFEALEDLFNVERSLKSLSLHKLLLAYRSCLHREKIRNKPPHHQIWRYPYNVPTQKKHLLQRLSEETKIRFLDLLKIASSPSEKPLLCVFNLLATLELWQQGEIQVQSTDQHNDFYLLAKKA